MHTSRDHSTCESDDIQHEVFLMMEKNFDFTKELGIDESCLFIERHPKALDGSR